MRSDPYSSLFHSHLNGRIYTLVPDQVLLFDEPDDATARDEMWVDRDSVRHFSSHFYADLLKDLGVALVVSFDPSDTDECEYR